MPTFSSPSNTSALSARRPSIGIMLMLSVPAAITMSASPVRMRSAAIETAFSPDEQKRLIVMPGTPGGNPASSTPMRATFIPCSYSGIAQPTITSSTRAGSIDGTCASTRLSTCASRVSGRVARYAPRGALPTGVRVVATTQASCICIVIRILLSPPHRASPTRRGVAPCASVAQRLPRRKRVRDPRLRAGVAQQLHELAALDFEQPAFVDETARIDIATTHRAREPQAYLESPGRDECTFAQVDEH